MRPSSGNTITNIYTNQKPLKGYKMNLKTDNKMNANHILPRPGSDKLNLFFSSNGKEVGYLFTSKVTNLLFIFSILLSGSVGFSQVSTWTGGTSGAWLTSGNWSPSGAPSGTGAEAYININTQPTMGVNMNGITVANSSIGAVHFDASATSNRTIQNSSGTVGGTFTLNGLTINSVNNVILRNNSSANLTIQNGSNTFNLGLGNSTENVINIDGTGNIVINSVITGTGRNLVKGGSGSGVLELSNANTYSGLTTVTGGTLRLNRTGGNTLPSTNNVEVTGGTLQVNTNQTLNNLTVGPGGNVNVAAGVNLIINGTLSVSSTSNFGSGNIIVNGTLKIEEGGYPGSTGSWTFGFGSTLQFANTSGLYVVNNEVWWPASSGPENVYVTGAGGLQMNVSRTVSGYFDAHAQIAGSALTLDGFVELSPGGYFSTAPNYGAGSTLYYNTGGIYGRGFEWSNTSNPGYPHHVIVNGSTSLDLGNDGTGVLRRCAGNLTIQGGSALYMDYGLNDMTQPLEVEGNLNLYGTLSLSGVLGGDLKVRGNFSNGGTLNNNGRAVFFDGTTDQNIGGQPLDFDYLIVDKSGGELILDDDVTVNQTLTLTNGVVNTNTYLMTVACTGNIARTNGWVNGDLKVCIPTGAGVSRILAVGSDMDYAGVDISFGNVSASGDLHATTAKPGSAPQIGAVPAGSGLSQTKYLDRSWSISNTGTTFDTYDATFNFVASDIEGSANPNNFIAGKKDGPTWSAPVVGTKTATSTQITGVTSFSEFFLAEACVPPAITSATAGASPICPAATTTLTANGVTGDGAMVTWYTGPGATGSNLGSGLTLGPVGPGTYYAWVTGDCGTAEAMVTVGAKVNVGITSISPAANPICADQTTTLTATGVVGDGAVVTWYTGPGGTGANLGTGLSLAGAATGTTYYARVTGECGAPAEVSLALTEDGPVYNTTSNRYFCAIQSAINHAGTMAGHTLEISSGTYNEQVIVDKGVTLKGVGLTKPTVDFTGTPTGKLTLFDVSADGVTIENIRFNVDLAKLSSAVIASAASLDNITIKDNTVDAYGTPPSVTNPHPLVYGNRNAFSINYSGNINYRVASGGVNSVIFTGNTVNVGLSGAFRSAISADEVGGTFSNNTLQTINHDILIRFGSNGNINVTNNTLNGGGVELAEHNAGAGTITVSGNTFDGTFGNTFVTPRTAVLRLKNNQQNKVTNVSNNTFIDHRFGLSLENYKNVTIDGNTFTPETSSTDFVHIGVNTKSISSNSNTIVQTEVNGTFTNNTFNGSGVAGGTGIGFYNHDSDAASFGTFTIGSAGNENDFGADIAQFIRLDNQTGSSDAAMIPTDYPNGGGWTTTMACWNQNYDIRNNRFNVGAGLQLPSAMNFTQRTALEGALFHKPDASCTGLLTYFLPVHNVTQNVRYYTIQEAITAANPNDVIECSEWTYNERVTINKSLTLKGVNEANCILTGTGLAGVGSGITINNGITGVTIKKLTVQNFAGSGPNSYAGIYAVGGNNNLTVEEVTIKDNVGGSGFYANGPVNTITLDNLDVSGHPNSSGQARGIVIWNGLKENITIINCNVYDNACCGIELQDGTATGVNISNNNIYNNADNGLGITGLQGPLANVISGNTLTNNGRFGIEVKNPDGNGAASGAGSIAVTGNTVTRTVPIGAELRDIAGIALMRISVLAGNVDVPTGVYVSGNTVSGYTQPSNSDGFGIVVAGTNHTVTGNTVTGNDVGIQQQAGHTPYPGNGDQSNLADQYFGRDNTPWTCGNNISSNTLTNTIDTRDVGPVGGAGFITNTNTGRTFCSIQTAHNHTTTLDGHTLILSPGTFTENVIITKRLTIDGAGSGSNPATNSVVASAVSGSPVITYNAGGSDATNRQVLKDVRVTGATGGTGNPNSGVLVQGGGSYFTFDNVASVSNTGSGFAYNLAGTLTDIKYENCDLSNNGNAGLRLAPSTAIFSGLSVKNSTFSNNGIQGLFHSGSASSTGFTIEDCTFTGNGSNSFAGAGLGYGDLILNNFNGNASIKNVNINGRTVSDAAMIGMQIRGVSPLASAGTVSLENINITGAYRRPSMAATLPGGQGNALEFRSYTNADNVSFTNVNINNTAAGHGLVTFEMGSVLNIGDTDFGVPTATDHGGVKAFSIVNGSAAAGRINAQNATFSGLSKAVVAENYQIADRISDAVDNSAQGYVDFKNAESFVTTNSFNAPATTTPSIQRAVNAVSDPGSVYAQAGTTYTGGVDLSAKAVNLHIGESPACVTISGNMVLNNDDDLNIDLDGTTACTAYDQFTVNGTVTLGGASLNLNLGYTPYMGDNYTIIDNDGADPVNGIFAEGYSVEAGGHLFSINYAGGDGNDVVLTKCSGDVVNVTKFKAFCSIQAAIDDPVTTAGDVITVAAGTYNETVLLNKSVTLRGPNHSLVPCVDTRVAEAVITGGLNIPNGSSLTVVVEGFHFQGVSSPMSYNGNVGTATLNATFKNNLINSSSGQLAVFVGNPTNNAIVNITDNCFQNMTGNAMQLGGGDFVTTINNNIINTTGTAGINTDAIINSTISNNTISNTGQQGIQVAGVSGNVNITSNVITNCNTSAGADRGGIRLRGANYSGAVTVTNNIISGSLNGVAVANGENITGKTINVNDNNLAGNTSSVYHGGTGSLNAECNWHGSSNYNTILSQLGGAGAGDVDFVSFLLDNGDGPGFGFQPTGVCDGTPVIINSVSTTPNQFCQNDGSITVNFSGGTANYTVAWSGAASGSTPVLSSPCTTSSTLPNGNYTITVTDANGSTTTAMATVGNSPVRRTSAGP
jgi:autotransporter-associated beta strand protein